MSDAASLPTGRPGSSLNLADGVFRHAGSQPLAPALVIEGRIWSYAELRDSAARIAAWLGPRVGDRPFRVGILASRSYATYAGILGVACAGGTYVPLNPKQPPARVASILERAGLSALITGDSAAVLAGNARVRDVLPARVLTLDDSGVPAAGDIATGPDAATQFPAVVAADHPAYIMFTSGTTGVPKGVVVTAGNVGCFLAAVRERYGIHPGDRVGQICETSFDLSVFEVFAAWDGGACLYVVPESQLMAPAGFIRREKLTVWTSVPSVISMLSRMKMLEPGLFPTLRVSFFIGEALSVRAAQQWRAAAPGSVVDNHYGPTEAAVACTVQRVGDPVVETPGRGTVAIGLPYPGMEAEVISEAGGFVTDGSTGELALSGPQVAAGYLDDDAQTARRFPVLEHPRLGRRRWYLTGDLAFRDEHGILHWLGRTDHQVKILGNRVELEDLEAHLRVAGGTDAVAAIAWPLVHGNNGNATGIAAFLCGATASPAEIRERLRQLVPSYMVPRLVLEIDSLPLSANGKVDRAALRAKLDEKR